MIITFYEAIEFLKKNPKKIVIENNPGKRLVTALNTLPNNQFGMSIYGEIEDEFGDWDNILLTNDLISTNFKVYEKKFILSDHGVKRGNSKELLFKSSYVEECQSEILRKIEEQVKPQLANGVYFINRKDTLRIITETFGEFK